MPARPLGQRSKHLPYSIALKSITASLEWDLLDFLFAAALIFIPVLIYDGTTRQRTYRAAIRLALLAVSLLIYLTASVGIIGDPSNPNNLLYLMIIAAGLSGGYAARQLPEGMSKTMLAISAVQVLIAVVAVLGQLGDEASGPFELVAINAVFVVMWLPAAIMIKKHLALRLSRRMSTMLKLNAMVIAKLFFGVPVSKEVYPIELDDIFFISQSSRTTDRTIGDRASAAINANQGRPQCSLLSIKPRASWANKRIVHWNSSGD